MKPHPPGLPRDFDLRRDRRWGDPARRTDTRPYGPESGRAIAPSRRPSPDHRPTGEQAPTNSSGARASARKQNSANVSENRTAEVSAGYGFRTRQKPPVPPDHPSVKAGRVDPKKDPDYEIEGRFFDGKWIEKGTPLRTIRSRIDGSINSKQAEGVILDMTDSRITRDELVDFLRRDYPPELPLRAEVWYRRGDEMFPIWP